MQLQAFANMAAAQRNEAVLQAKKIMAELQALRAEVTYPIRLLSLSFVHILDHLGACIAYIV